MAQGVILIFNYMIFNNYYAISTIVSKIPAWIPAYAGMTGLKDFLVKITYCKGFINLKFKDEI